MNLIDPFTFRDMFRAARSVALVGNAPCILDWNNGATIDSHDLVVRFNRATTDGLQERIGSRTDILFVNAANSLAMAPSPQETVQPRCLVCFVSPQGVKEFDIAPFRQWARDLPVLLTFGPDLIGLPGLHHTRPLTSGTYALFTLLRLFAMERLFVTGFTMFGAVAGGAGKYYEDKRPGVGNFHDLDQEATLFASLLESFDGQLTVTDEVQSLARRTGVSLLPKADSLGRIAKERLSLRQRLADGLAWRFLHAGMSLRRLAESK